jgi:hypothetical protein
VQDYALALSSRLAANGIHGQLMFYRWQIRNTAIEGSHVFGLYALRATILAQALCAMCIILDI